MDFGIKHERNCTIILFCLQIRLLQTVLIGLDLNQWSYISENILQNICNFCCLIYRTKICYSNLKFSTKNIFVRKFNLNCCPNFSFMIRFKNKALCNFSSIHFSSGFPTFSVLGLIFSFSDSHGPYFPFFTTLLFTNQNLFHYGTIIVS